MNVVDVPDVELAFPANGWKLLPEEGAAKQFAETEDGKRWVTLVNDLFYGRNEREALSLSRKPHTTEPEKVWRMVCCALGTFGCKHERKVSGVAYMLAYFFSDYAWTPKES